VRSLAPAPDPLPADFAEALAPDRLPALVSRIIYYATIGSTNDVAAAVAAEPDGDGVVVIADAQTSGRGRRGHQWFSPPAGGLYVSLVVDPGRSMAPGRATALVTMTAGVALAEGIESITGLAPDIKWPNDLFVGRRKLAGILAEGVSGWRPEGAPSHRPLKVVLGFGINVAATAFPPELASRVTSLQAELGRPIDRAKVCAGALAALSRRYEDLVAGRFDAILSRWRARAPLSEGHRVRWRDGDRDRAGTTMGVDDDGALLVQAGDQVERIVAGIVIWD